MTDAEIRTRLADHMIADPSQALVDDVRARLAGIAMSSDPGAALVLQHVDLTGSEPRIVFATVHSSRRGWMPGRTPFC